MLLPEQTLLYIPLQVGGVYCVRGQMVLGTHSSSTDTQCVSITHAGTHSRTRIHPPPILIAVTASCHGNNHHFFRTFFRALQVLVYGNP